MNPKIPSQSKKTTRILVMVLLLVAVIVGGLGIGAVFIVNSMDNGVVQKTVQQPLDSSLFRE